jgi:hypothetical protein
MANGLAVGLMSYQYLFTAHGWSVLHVGCIYLDHFAWTSNPPIMA